MIQRFPRMLVLPALLAGLSPATALAELEPKGFYVTLYGQYSQIGSSNFTESGALGAGSGLRADFGGGSGLGGDIGWRYGNGWAAEVEWSYRSHSIDPLKQGGSYISRDGDFASNTLLINGLRRFPTGGAWTPYVGAGLGWVQEIDADFKTTSGGMSRSYSATGKAAFQAIAGVEYAFTPKWRLTADARWLRVGSVQLDNETGNPGGTVNSLTYNPISVQVGLRYSF